MKRTMMQLIMVVLVGVCMTATAFAADIHKSAKGKEIKISGKLTCSFCPLSHPGTPCPGDCCENCIKAGDPPLLTDAKGNQFMLLTGEHEVPLMDPEKYEMVGGMVDVEGILVKGKGVQVIFVDKMKKKDDKKKKR
jgi:hypothetical protein